MSLPTIEAAQARHDVLVADALLVCAHDAKDFSKYQLEKSIPLEEFESQVAELPASREIIFYCNCPHDERAISQAEKYQEQGYPHAKVLRGGFKAWQSLGFPVPGTAS